MLTQLAAKFLALWTQPLAWVALLLLLALLLWRRPKAPRRLLIGALVLLLLIGWQPLPDLLLRNLERQYTEFDPDATLQAYAGVVVLGGAQESGALAQAHAQPLLNGSAERMTTVTALLRHQPRLRVVFTGGEGRLIAEGATEAARAKAFFDTQGVPPDRVVYESASRNTYENAVLSAQLPGIAITEPWLLLTSAWHMPRAMATFEAAGWNITAYPVDFRTADRTNWTEYSLLGGADRWQIALHELLGLAAYRLSGRI